MSRSAWASIGDGEVEVEETSPGIWACHDGTTHPTWVAALAHDVRAWDGSYADMDDDDVMCHLREVSPPDGEVLS